MANCVSGGVEYSEGSLICSNGRELKCIGGAWQETGYSCSSKNDDPMHYTRFAADGLSSTEVSAASPLLQCVQYVIGAPYGQIRLYNSCSTCKLVTISWSDGQIQRERVQANSHKDIPNRAQASQLVGEQNC